MRRNDNNYLVVKEQQRIDQMLADAEAYRKTDAGKVDQARLYSDEIAAEKRTAEILAVLPENCFEQIDAGELNINELARQTGYSVEEIEEAEFADEPKHKHLWNIVVPKRHWEQ